MERDETQLQQFVDRAVAKYEFVRMAANAATELACKEMETSVRMQLAVVVAGGGKVEVDSDTYADAWLKYFARLISKMHDIGRGNITLEDLAAWAEREGGA